MQYQKLKEQQRKDRENYSEQLGLRVHRALSWLKRSEEETGLDEQFIFLWIAFNAAYATEYDDYRSSEQKQFSRFLDRLCELDQNKSLDKVVWEEFPSSIRVLLNNKYVFREFWMYQRQEISEQEWQEKFKRATDKAVQALGSKGDTVTTLSIVFSRLYVLRNQIIHGGATHNSSVNRTQLKDAVNILRRIVPVIIKIMMDNHQRHWGEAAYPVVK